MHLAPLTQLQPHEGFDENLRQFQPWQPPVKGLES